VTVRWRWRRAPRTLSSIHAYALWAASYPPHAHNPLMQAEQDAMRALLPDLRGAVVLDAASGTGRYGLLAQALGARAVWAIDNSPHMLRASPLAGRVLASLEALPLASGSVDVVLCGMAIGHTLHLAACLGEMARVLRPGGAALISDFHPCLHFSGAQRTFSAGGRVYAVEHHPHLYSAWHDAARSCGLHLDALREPTLSSGGAPVVLVMRWITGQTGDGGRTG
jgi:malonyl-CoA O-methyltransferase